MTIRDAQLFCTVADLVADKPAPGVDEARMFQAIEEASTFLQKEIGWFVPVTLTRFFHGHGAQSLRVPPLLSLTSIWNADVLLTTDEYLLQPDDGFWTNGPYVELLVAPSAPTLTCWMDQQHGVEILGHWGKYECLETLNASVQDATGQSDSQTTLQVNDGGQVSPGMVLLVDAEQQAITGWDTPTSDITTLTSAISTTDEVITVQDGSLVHVGETLRLDFEQMRVKDKRANQLSVVRSWNGTGRVAHSTDTAVDIYRTVTVKRGVNGTTAASHAQGTALARYVVPDDILFLTKEIATLSVNKAQSGYQGKTGNAETGMVFYNDSFPQFDIQKIKSNYYIPRVG